MIRSNSFPRRVTYHLSKTVRTRVYTQTIEEGGIQHCSGKRVVASLWRVRGSFCGSFCPSRRRSRRPWGTPRCHVYVNYVRLWCSMVNRDGEGCAMSYGQGSIIQLSVKIYRENPRPTRIMLKRGGRGSSFAISLKKKEKIGLDDVNRSDS